jgi:predicted alpha/beta-fold hydrolase
MDIIGFLGSARTSFTYSRNPINLYTKAGNPISIAELCQTVTPPCRLNPLLFNGHLQTFWTVVKSQDVPIYYKRKVFEAEDPKYAGTFAVDFVVEPYKDVESDMPPRTTHYSEDEFSDIGSLDTKPMLVTLHGLSGGSHELYLRHVLAPLVSNDGGWAACVVNSRGCAMSKITSGVLYNARATWDVRQVVRWLRETFPNRELYGIGFSLGANILTNVCTRDQSDRNIDAGIDIAGLRSTSVKRAVNAS